MTGAIHVSDILDQLDRSSQELEFPTFENAYYFVAVMRLTAFRDAAEWFIAFEELCYSKNEHCFLNKVFAYGNKVPSTGYQWATKIITKAEDMLNGEEDQNFVQNPWEFEIKVNGNKKSFSVTLEDYQNAGIDLPADMKPELRVIRLLSNLIHNELFLSDKKLLHVCNQTNMSKLIQLTEWHHPSMIKEELPSQFACFQNLALAIAENDKNLYNNPEPVNTYWYFWDQD